MGEWKDRLSTGSRDRRTLIKAAAVTAALSLGLGLFLDVAVRQAPVGDGDASIGPVGNSEERPVDFEKEQERLLRPPKLSEEMVVSFLLRAADLYGKGGGKRLENPEAEERDGLLLRAGPVVVGEFLLKSEMGEGTRLAFDRYARAMFLTGGKSESGKADLVAMASEEGVPRYANLLLADLLRREGDLAGAMAALREVRGDVLDGRVRLGVVQAALKSKDEAVISEIRGSRGFDKVLTWKLERELAVVARDYVGLFGAVFMDVFANSPGLLFIGLSLIGTAAWFFILVGFVGFSGHRWWWFVVPVFAGVFSVVPTLFILILQEDINGMAEVGELPQDLLYYVGGVGLREEVSKMLLFALFLPFLLKKRSPVHAVITAACVGLGFAAEENIRYFARFLSLDPHAGVSSLSAGVGFTRYVTATCIHMFLTGTLGYALYWFCSSPRRYYEMFLGAFIFVVLIHGFYDVVLSDGFANLDPEGVGRIFDGGMAQWITIGIAAACAFRFFGNVDASRIPGRRLISPLGLFVVGGASIWGATLMMACLLIPFGDAFSESGKAGLSMALIAWIYINRFREE